MPNKLTIGDNIPPVFVNKVTNNYFSSLELLSYRQHTKQLKFSIVLRNRIVTPLVERVAS